jgi:hypothetical protein
MGSTPALSKCRSAKGGWSATLKCNRIQIGSIWIEERMGQRIRAIWQLIWQLIWQSSLIGLLAMGALQLLLLAPAQASQWTKVVTAADGTQAQYVDLDSIHRINHHIRLDTYWLETAHPQDKTYATTEYDCDRQRYRDTQVNGQATKQDWQDLTHDPLNRAVMDYACAEFQLDARQ